MIKYFGASIKAIYFFLEAIVSFDKDYPFQDSLKSQVTALDTYNPDNILSVVSINNSSNHFIKISYAILRVHSNN